MDSLGQPSIKTASGSAPNTKIVSASGQFQKEKSEAAEDDDMIDDFLDDSMELQESNTIASSSKAHSKTNSVNKDQSNKVYSSSPSKLNEKFNHHKQQRNAKQQDLK